VQIVSDVFDGKSTIQRHKLIYALLDNYIKTGEIHALTIKAMTISESKK
jgi:acid stress-induced BolA-like protein IbaG/YrbA